MFKSIAERSATPVFESFRRTPSRKTATSVGLLPRMLAVCFPVEESFIFTLLTRLIALPTSLAPSSSTDSISIISTEEETSDEYFGFIPVTSNSSPKITVGTRNTVISFDDIICVSLDS